MTIRQLRYFVAVAEEQSFTAASGLLHIAQPPLSAQVRAFERDLGAELFRRSHRGAELTPAGRPGPAARGPAAAVPLRRPGAAGPGRPLRARSGR